MSRGYQPLEDVEEHQGLASNKRGYGATEGKSFGNKKNQAALKRSIEQVKQMVVRVDDIAAAVLECLHKWMTDGTSDLRQAVSIIEGRTGRHLSELALFIQQLSVTLKEGVKGAEDPQLYSQAEKMKKDFEDTINMYYNLEQEDEWKVLMKNAKKEECNDPIIIERREAFKQYLDMLGNVSEMLGPSEPQPSYLNRKGASDVGFKRGCNCDCCKSCTVM